MVRRVKPAVSRTGSTGPPGARIGPRAGSLSVLPVFVTHAPPAKEAPAPRPPGTPAPSPARCLAVDERHVGRAEFGVEPVDVAVAAAGGVDGADPFDGAGVADPHVRGAAAVARHTGGGADLDHRTDVQCAVVLGGHVDVDEVVDDLVAGVLGLVHVAVDGHQAAVGRYDRAADGVAVARAVAAVPDAALAVGP